MRGSAHGLIGDGPNCLIPSQPPKEAREARRAAMDRDFGKYVHEKGRRPEDWDAFTGYRDGEKRGAEDEGDSEAAGGKGPGRGKEAGSSGGASRSVDDPPGRGQLALVFLMLCTLEESSITRLLVDLVPDRRRPPLRA